MARPSTTTSYAILCLLAVRNWTAYELAQQMERSVGSMWPRAESVVYEEPKRLVALGLATATATFTGKRASTTYGITAKGRRALRRWLAQPGAGPATEFEGLLKVAFADHGSIEGLRMNLLAIRQLAEADTADTERRFREYAETGGPFPDRLPIIALAAEYFRLQTEALLRWVDWAERETREWTGVTVATGAQVPADAFTTPGGGARRAPSKLNDPWATDHSPRRMRRQWMNAPTAPSSPDERTP